MSSQTFNITIILPGLTGSQLLDASGNIVWPLKLIDLKVLPENVAAEIENATTLGMVLGFTNSNSLYGGLANYLIKNLNANTDSNTPDPIAVNVNLSNYGLPDTLSYNWVVGYPYDWRQDNRTCATALENFLSYLALTYENIGNIYFVGHSMGGLLARTYLEVSGNATAPIYAKIKGLITLGTPHLGAPLAIQPITNTLNIQPYAPKLFVIEDVYIEKMAEDFVDTKYGISTCELLPPPQNPALSQTLLSYVNFINIQSGEDITQANVFDNSSIAYKNLIAITPPNSEENTTQENLESAQGLLTQLIDSTYGNGRSNLPTYYCIYASGQNTPISVTFNNGEWVTNLSQQEGDNIVPTWSAMFLEFVPSTNVFQATEIGTTHINLPQQPSVQQQIVSWIAQG